MIEHKDDIYSRPKRTWFTTEREKKLVAKAAKVNPTTTIVICVEVSFRGSFGHR